MEFSFGDDLFDDGQKENKKKKATEPYEAKVCTKEWFVERSFVPEKLTLEDCQTMKFQADRLYFRKEYQAALEKYNDRLQYMYNKNNNAMLREVHGSIINCHLKLGSLEQAKEHVSKLLKTPGNPFDSYIHFLGYQVYQNLGNTKECGKHLFNAITINPWYVDYWLKLYELLYGFYSCKHDGVILADVSVNKVDDELLKILLIHIEFILGENVKSNSNSSNLKHDNTTKKIEDYWETLVGAEYKDIKHAAQELYHTMSRARDLEPNEVIQQHPCFHLYKKIMLKPLLEAKNF